MSPGVAEGVLNGLLSYGHNEALLGREGSTDRIVGRLDLVFEPSNVMFTGDGEPRTEGYGEYATFFNRLNDNTLYDAWNSTGFSGTAGTNSMWVDANYVTEDGAESFLSILLSARARGEEIRVYYDVDASGYCRYQIIEFP